MNRLDNLFETKSKNLLSLYFTAGYPEVSSTHAILTELIKQPVDMVEVGLPFSDPMADGPVIQNSSHTALQNGITIERILADIALTKQVRSYPVVIMSYLNPILAFGIEKFCDTCEKAGVAGLILPDLPLEYYQEHYTTLFKKHNLQNIPMIAPGSSSERMVNAAKSEAAFIYAVSSKGTTGTSLWEEETYAYLKEVTQCVTPKPVMVGFGIHTHERFKKVCEITHGAIIGSAFVEALKPRKSLANSISTFITKIRNHDHPIE
ncbi:MAG: tryptophan synthase subunit alpha [Bacteroidota bacterium]